MNQCGALYVSLLACCVFAQASEPQWTPLQPLSGTDSIGSPGGTHPLVANGDTVHAVWWQDGTIWYRRSDDAGRTWAQPVRLTFSGKAQYPCSLELAGAVLHLVWTDSRNGGWELYYMHSTDAAKTWEKEVRLTPGIDLFRFGTAVSGTNVHIVWGSRSRLQKVPVGQSSWTWTWGDIYHLASVDGGATWGTPVRLNPKPGTAMRPAVAASDRFVHVTWYDQYAAKKNPAWDWDIYYRRSVNQGAAWSPEVRMTATPMHSRHPQIVATPGNRVCCIWEDGQIFDGTGMVGDPALYAAVSTDNGETWGRSRRITTINAPNGFATHAKAYASGSRVHLTWQDAPDGTPHPRAIYYMTSADGGITWGTPERLTPASEEGWETGGVVGTKSWALVEMMKGGGLWYRRRDLTPDSTASKPGDNGDIRGPKPSFPRLMGMNIGAKNYDDPAYQKELARLDVVILGFYKGWKPSYGMPKVVRSLKELSGGKILVGQYTILNECRDDPKNAATLDVLTKLNDMDWWARKADRSRVQWTAQYHAWDINFTAGSRPDANGQRFPQWLAERDDAVFFKPVPFDLWYCDNVFFRPRVTADWNHDGTDDDPKSPAVAAAYRAGQRAEWDHIRRIHPGLPLMGNAEGNLSEPEYAGQLEGAFLEGLMGKSWSIEKWAGWPKAMSRYHDVMANTRAPHIVGFNVHGDPADYRFFRYAYASCLLDDGYFCFTANDKEYSSVTWFDEFDFKLGTAITQPPDGPWQNGVWRRDFEHGIALVNPAKQVVTVTLDLGLCRLKGKQDPATNDGNPATSVILQARDGIILRRQ